MKKRNIHFKDSLQNSKLEILSHIATLYIEEHRDSKELLTLIKPLKGISSTNHHFSFSLLNQEISPEDAFHALLKSALKGSVEAHHSIGLLFLNGLGPEKNDTKAAQWFKVAAERGDSAAQVHLGRLYLAGQGVPQNDEKSFEWFQKAYEQGNPYVHTELGNMYLEGRGVQQNFEKAFALFQTSAEQDDSQGQMYLGKMYLDGRGVEPDFRKAFQLFQYSANQDNSNGQSHLGMMHFEGKGVEKDLQQAYQWFCLALKSKEFFSTETDALDITGKVEALESVLTDSQKEAAHRFIESWEPTY